MLDALPLPALIQSSPPPLPEPELVELRANRDAIVERSSFSLDDFQMSEASKEVHTATGSRPSCRSRHRQRSRPTRGARRSNACFRHRCRHALHPGLCRRASLLRVAAVTPRGQAVNYHTAFYAYTSRVPRGRVYPLASSIVSCVIDRECSAVAGTTVDRVRSNPSDEPFISLFTAHHHPEEHGIFSDSIFL